MGKIVAFTAKSRKQKILQDIIKRHGPLDPEALVYTEDKPSGVITVRNRSGRILGQYH